MSGALRIAVRVFVIGKLQSEETLEATEEELSEIMPRLAAKHAELSEAEPTMIELEFIDDPSNGRFFRIGTDPNGMVMPVAIEGGPNEVLASLGAAAMGHPLEEADALVCSRDPSVKGSIRDRCSKCQHFVWIAPSGQKRRLLHPAMPLLCEACFLTELIEKGEEIVVVRPTREDLVADFGSEKVADKIIQEHDPVLDAHNAMVRQRYKKPN